MSSKDQPSIVNNFHNINAGNVHAGVGDNVNNPNTSSNLTESLLRRKVQKECEELRKKLKENAIKNSPIDGVSFVQKDQRHVRYVPLHMTEYNVKDKSLFKEEGQQTRDLQPSGDLKLENLFQKSQEFSKKSPQYKAADSRQAKDCLNRLSRVVGLIAQAGMGKTCLAKQALKLVVDKKFKADYIFYLKFRDIDYKSKTNLLSLLTGDQRYEKLNQQILSKIINIISENKKTFLIFDGLDESTLTFDTDTAINADEMAKAETFILRMLSGDIFPHAKILLTSRPFQLVNLPEKYRPSYIVQITGISKSSQRLICEDICGNQAHDIFNHVQNYTKLSSYCSSPFMCIVIMYCLLKTHKTNKNSILPTNLTEVFLLLILLYIKDETHVRGSINLKNLCTLAWNGISNRKFLFDKSDMREAGLEKIEKNDFTITIECEDNRNKFTLLSHDTTQFTYFSHLSVEEFFAAFQIVFVENLEEFKKLFSPESGVNLSSTNFDMFALFVFGLCSESTLSQYFDDNFLLDFDRDLYSQKIIMTKQFLQGIPLTFYDGRNAVPSLTPASLKTIEWVHQFNDVTLTRHFAHSLENPIAFETNRILPNYFLPLNYLLRHRSEKIVVDHVIYREGGERFVEELGNAMNKNHNIELIWFDFGFTLDEEKVSYFAICLRKLQHKIWARFATPKAASKFADIILERETQLGYLGCWDVKPNDNRTKSNLRRCQEKVKDRIEFH